MGALGRFLLAAASLAKKGVKESEVLEFAKREFGEVSELMKAQIRKLYKNKDAPSIKNPAKQEGEVVPFKKDQASGIMERIGKASSRIEELAKEQQSMYKPKQGLQLVEGLTRTITRKILGRKNIEIPKGSDPIEVFSDTFGESIGDVSNLAEELIEIDQRGGASGSIDDMIQKDGLFDIEIPKNPQRGLTDEEFKQLKKEVDQEKTFKDFDPTDREPNAMGGFNRIGYAVGTGIKLAKFFKDKGTTLAAEIRKAVDNIFASGDSKYDADVAVDSALEEFGVDREMFDQMDIINAYDEAYQTIVKQKGLASQKVPGGTQVFKDSEGGIKGITMGGDKDFQKAMSEAMDEGMRESENMRRLGLDPSKMDDALKYDEMKEAGQIEKNVTGSADLSPVEDLKREFPGITDEMIENILTDTDPQRIAEVKQTMREAMAMEQKGMNVDEIINTFKNQKRTKQANGGLSYLMGM